MHAKPEIASAQLLQPGAFSDPDYIDALDIIYNAIPLIAFQIPLWAAVEKLIPTFQFRSALRSYVGNLDGRPTPYGQRLLRPVAS